MKKLFFIITCTAIIFSSCDTTDDVFESSNTSPVLSLKSPYNTSFGDLGNDSIKISQEYYNLDFKIEDEELLTLDVEIDSIFKFEVKDNQIIFGAEKEGTSNITITVTDSWKNSDQVQFKLTCFTNLPAKAALEIKALSKIREKLLDASKSIDLDERYGGEIILYRFFVNGKEIEKTYHKAVSYTFPEVGEYRVGVQVMDNNEEWSSIVYQTINI